MKICILSSVFAIFFCSTISYSQIAPPTSDFQFWNETQLVFPLRKAKDKKGKEFDRISFLLTGNLRFGRNLTHFVDERIGFGFDFKINQYLTLTPSYLYSASQPYRGRREFENRLRFAVNLEKKFKRFSIRDRNLIEYRLRNSRADLVRYRNKFQFTFPIHREKKEIFAPFVADEVYYDFREKTWTRNELTLGINKKFTRSFSADFFYLLRNNKATVLKYVNALGVNLKIRID